MRRDGLSVAVIGGGIGGLTAGLSLLKAGLDVHVYEQSSRISEVGAGIAISPNATRILYRLGLEHELARTGVRPTAWWQRRWDDGRTLSRTPLGAEIEKRFGSPHYQMHRGDLVAAVARALPATRLHTGHRLLSLVDDGDTVEARFENGETTRADVLIGADGIHSAVRDGLRQQDTAAHARRASPTGTRCRTRQRNHRHLLLRMGVALPTQSRGGAHADSPNRPPSEPEP